MFARSQNDIHKAHDALEGVKRLSDRVIGIGPINIIGIDGILAWIPIPGLATVYSVLAGLFILLQGIRARCDIGTLLAVVIVIAMDSGISLFDGFPLIPAGSIVDTFFQGHLYAAHVVQKNIEKTLYVEGSSAEAHRSGEHAEHVAEMRATKGKNRIVYLG